MGQSRAMYRLELEEPAARGDTFSRRTVIARVEQWGLLGTHSADEVRTMRALRVAGYPVAEILAYDPSTEVLAQPFFVMEFVEGSSLVTPESLEEYVMSLDRLHRMDPAALELDFLERPKGPRDAALQQVVLDRSSPALRALMPTMPRTASPSFVYRGTSQNPSQTNRSPCLSTRRSSEGSPELSSPTSIPAFQASRGS